MGWDGGGKREVQEGGDTCILTNDSYCTAETNMALQSNYLLIKNNEKKKKKKKKLSQNVFSPVEESGKTHFQRKKNSTELWTLKPLTI